MKWQTEVVHETQNQRQTVWSKKKSEQQETHAELLLFSVHKSRILQSLWGEEKKKKMICHKAVCCAVALKRPRYPNRKHHEIYWQYLRAHQEKHLSNRTGSCLLRENSTNRTVGLEREKEEK